jgi:DNA invertase Pin-like site-specific DNA recombinase
MLKAIRTREVNTVVVWKLNRLARSTQELINRLNEFRGLGVDFLSVTEGWDTTTAQGRLLYTILAGFAEFDNEQRSEAIRAGLATARRKGVRLGRPGKPQSLIDLLHHLQGQGLTIAGIVRETGLPRNTVKKYLRLKKIDPGAS